MAWSTPWAWCHVLRPFIWWVHPVGVFYRSLASTVYSLLKILPQNGLMLTVIAWLGINKIFNKHLIFSSKRSESVIERKRKDHFNQHYYCECLGVQCPFGEFVCNLCLSKLVSRSVNWLRCIQQMVSNLPDSRSSSQGLSPVKDLCIVSLGRTLYYQSASVHPGVYERILANVTLGITLCWTSIQSRGE